MVHRQHYIAKRELKKENRIAAGLVSDHYPEVSGMVIHMTYYQRASNPILMIRTVNFFPNSYAYFHMECMIKGCDNGGFDLTSVITNLIKNHKKSGKGKMACSRKNGALGSDHAHISYNISIQYNPHNRSSE